MEIVPLHRRLSEGSVVRVPRRRGRRRSLPPVVPAFLRAALGEALAAAGDPRVRELLPLVGFRAPGIRGPDPGEWEGLDPWTVVRTQLLAHEIRRRTPGRPVELVGVAWGLREPLGLDESGLTAYVRSHPWTTEESDRAVECARSTQEALRRLDTSAISQPGIGAPVLDLNPAAGTHRITTDPLELEAALRAGERSWSRMPYYRLRYGERGAAFTRSDSAWLVTLCDAEFELALAQVLWLGRLLSVRGMPRWLLEDHLEVLYGELKAVAPGPGERYEPLVELSRVLGQMRSVHMPDERLVAADRRFDADVGQDLAEAMPSAGALLAAARADAADGLVTALPAVSDWMADPRRFPRRWIAAVEATLEQLQAEGG